MAASTAAHDDSTFTDEILTVSVSGENHDAVRAFVERVRSMDGYRKDNIVLQEDTRRNIGHLGCRYSTVVLHV